VLPLVGLMGANLKHDAYGGHICSGCREPIPEPLVDALCPGKVRAALEADRYQLFVFDTYYPSGGADDHVGNFATIQAAKDAAHLISENHGVENAHIYDRIKDRVVACAEGKRKGFGDRYRIDQDSWEVPCDD